jgi:hypothetical protein
VRKLKGALSHQLPSTLKIKMAEPLPSIRSSKTLKLAHLLVKWERPSIAQVVERALEHYAQGQPEREPAPDFYARILHSL